MRCMVCGQEMCLIHAVADETTLAPGFEHHTLVCPFCHDEEHRLVFVHQLTSLSPGSDTERDGPSVHDPMPLHVNEPAAALTVTGEEPVGTKSGETVAVERKASPANYQSRVSRQNRSTNTRAWEISTELHRARWRLLCHRLGFRSPSNKTDEPK